MTIQEVLISKNIEFTQHGEWLNTWCPFVKHEKPKLFIHVQSGGWHCFLCGNGGHFRFFLEKIKAGNVEVELKAFEKEDDFDPPPLDADIVAQHHQNLLGTVSIVDYLKEKRGYSIDTIKKFQLGWDGRNILIPIFNANKELINIKFRRDPTLPDASKRMWQLSGRGQKRLFNEAVLKKKNDRVIIAEGEWDVMKLDQLGYSAVTSTGGAMSFDKTWIAAFERAEKIYICMDNDLNGVGQKAGVRIAKLFFEDGTKTWLITLPPLLAGEEKMDIVDFFVKRKKEKYDFTMLLHGAQQFQGELKAGEYNFLDWQDFNQVEFPPSKWLIDKILPKQGATIVAGMPGTRKSLFIAHFTACLLTGRKAFNHFDVEPSRVLLIDKENPPWLLQQRLRQLGVPDVRNRLEIFQGNFYLDNAQSMMALENHIIKNKIDVVMMDSYSDLHLKDENKAEDTQLLHDQITRIKKTGAAVLLLHHFNKGGFEATEDTNIMQILRGSINISGQVEVILGVFHTNIEKMVVRSGKNRILGIQPSFEIRADHFDNEVLFDYLGEVTASETRVGVDVQILTLIGDNELTLADLEPLLAKEIKRTALYNRLEKLVKKGTLTSYASERNTKVYAKNKEKHF